MYKYNEYLKPLTIGNKQLDNNILLAPMAGITDLPYRILCKEYGAGLVFTELISAKGILYDNKNTKDMLQIDEREKPTALQLFGSDPAILGQIAKKVDEYPFDFIDLNCGCPAPKIVKNGEGSALMLDPTKIGNIVSELAQNSSKPITVKIRKGFTNDSINAVEVAKIAEKNGASMITVHGRTRSEFFSGVADWDIIRQVKENVSIPVIANGDIIDGITAKKALDVTKADGVMVGRGIYGNPSVFKNIITYLETGEVLPPLTKSEVCSIVRTHTNMLCEYKGERVAVREMRKHLAWYTKGFHGSSKFRSTINKVETLDEINNLINEFEAL